MNDKTKILGGLVLVAIVLAAIGLSSKSSFNEENIVSRVTERVLEIIKSTGQKLGADVTNLQYVLNLGTTSFSQSTTTVQTISGLDNNGLFETVVTGTCADATSTLFAIANPLYATSTAQAVLDISQIGTTSLVVGANTNTEYLSVATGTVELPGGVVAYNPDLAAGTIGGFPTFRKIIDTVQLSSGLHEGHPYLDSMAIATSTSIGTSTAKTGITGKAVVGAYESVVGFVSGSNIISAGGVTSRPNDAIVNANNTFACTYKIKFSR